LGFGVPPPTDDLFFFFGQPTFGSVHRFRLGTGGDESDRLPVNLVGTGIVSRQQAIANVEFIHRITQIGKEERVELLRLFLHRFSSLSEYPNRFISSASERPEGYPPG